MTANQCSDRNSAIVAGSDTCWLSGVQQTQEQCLKEEERIRLKRVGTLLRQSYDGLGDVCGLIASVRSGDDDNAVVRAAFMKIELSERQEIVSIARNDTTL